ncbi:MAG: PIN domain-containing protein [Bacteroidota bacterium]
MRQTSDRVFADSNVLLYLLSDDARKKEIAKNILRSNPVISTQVISENVNVLFKKFKILTFEQVMQHASLLSMGCIVLPLELAIISKAFEIKSAYQFQWYDCTILAAAVNSQCNLIFSEDLQHGQVILGTLRVVNPFLP